jgi:hypothetical protein
VRTPLVSSFNEKRRDPGTRVWVAAGVDVTVLVRVIVAVPGGVLVREGVGVEVGVGLGVGVGLALSVALRVTVALAVGVGVAVGVALGVDVEVAVGVSVAPGTSVGVGLAVSVRLGVGVAVAEAVAVAVGLEVGVAVAESVAVAVGVAVGASDGVALGLAVGVAHPKRLAATARISSSTVTAPLRSSSASGQRCSGRTPSAIATWATTSAMETRPSPSQSGQEARAPLGSRQIRQAINASPRRPEADPRRRRRARKIFLSLPSTAACLSKPATFGYARPAAARLAARLVSSHRSLSQNPGPRSSRQMGSDSAGPEGAPVLRSSPATEGGNRRRSRALRRGFATEDRPKVAPYGAKADGWVLG